MTFHLKSVCSAPSLALVAAAPIARGQDAPPPPAAPGGGDEQPAPPPHHHGRGPTAEQLKAKLNLTDAQFTQVSAIFAKQRQGMIALHEDDTLSDDDRRDKMMALMKSSHDEIRALLTPDQQKIFDTLTPPRHGGPPPSQ